MLVTLGHSAPATVLSAAGPFCDKGLGNAQLLIIFDSDYVISLLNECIYIHRVRLSLILNFELCGGWGKGAKCCLECLEQSLAPANKAKAGTGILIQHLR